MKNIATKTLIFIFLLSACLTSAGNVLAQTSPLDAVGYYNLGVAHAAAGRWQEAIEAYKQTIRLNPDLARAHLGLGFVYLIIKDKGSALDEYKILKTLDPELANKLFNEIYK